jgi:hypothetical protein
METIMNKLVYFVAASTLFSTTAFAQHKALSTKHALRDSQMDSVTAGSSLVVGDGENNSFVNNTVRGNVTVGDGALNGATGVNLVNSSNSLVSNNVNLYTSQPTNQDSFADTKVNQINASVQTQKASSDAVFAEKDFGSEKLTFKATNIADDNANVNNINTDSVTLSGTAEGGAKGLNIVNSAGGAVSNNVNIVSATNVSSTPQLNQVNLSLMNSAPTGSSMALNDAEVFNKTKGSVTVGDGALEGATGLNLVNSSNSLVSDNVNIYSSKLANPDSSTGQSVNQINASVQTQKVSDNATNHDIVFNEFRDFDKATNIALSDAAVVNKDVYNVALSGTAEADVSAVNIVNAAGGIVNNNVNLAIASNASNTPRLNQVNLSVQRH